MSFEEVKARLLQPAADAAVPMRVEMIG